MYSLDKKLKTVIHSICSQSTTAEVHHYNVGTSGDFSQSAERLSRDVAIPPHNGHTFHYHVAMQVLRCQSMCPSLTHR